MDTPLAFNPPPPTEGFPWDNLRKIFRECQLTDGQGTNWGRKIAKNFNRLSRVHERYRRQTDQQAIASSEREREFTFSKMIFNQIKSFGYVDRIVTKLSIFLDKPSQNSSKCSFIVSEVAIENFQKSSLPCSCHWNTRRIWIITVIINIL